MAAEDGIGEGVGQGDGNVYYDGIAEMSSEERNDAMMHRVGGRWRPVPLLLSSFEEIPRFNFREEEYVEMCTAQGNMDWRGSVGPNREKLHLRLYKPFLSIKPWKRISSDYSENVRTARYELPACPRDCTASQPSAMYCHQNGTVIFSEVNTSLNFKTVVNGDNAREDDEVCCRLPIKLGPTVVTWCPLHIRHKENPWSAGNPADNLKFASIVRDGDILDDLSYRVKLRREHPEDVTTEMTGMFRMRMNNAVRICPGLSMHVSRDGVPSLDWHVAFRMLGLSASMEFYQIVANLPIYAVPCAGSEDCTRMSDAVDPCNFYH